MKDVKDKVLDYTEVSKKAGSEQRREVGQAGMPRAA